MATWQEKPTSYPEQFAARPESHGPVPEENPRTLDAADRILAIVEHRHER